jgi:hypothetical protein
VQGQGVDFVDQALQPVFDFFSVIRRADRGGVE